MDISGYSNAQLQDLRAHMDVARFPINFRKLEAEISRRKTDYVENRFILRFTQADGFRGWLQACLSLQPFYGTGSIAPGPSETLIEGWQRAWLGLAQQTEIAIASQKIRNAYSDHEWVAFDIQRRFWWSRHYTIRTPDATAASALVGLLPITRSRWFEKQETDIRDFYRLLRAPGRRPWITPLLVLICLTVYLAQAITGGYWLGLSDVTLVNWGANVGGLTVHGQWWRLLAAVFLHANPLHLAINMWVLWSTGRLTERLFGNLAYGTIYICAGLLGGLSSIAWSPAISTVGASGAIFGVLGALIVYLLHGGTRVPRRMMRAHLIPTLLFVLFSIVNGFGQIGVDNAAHVGGLLTGLLLGTAFAVPLNRHSNRFFLVQSGTAILLAILAATGLLLQVTGPASKLTPAEQFIKNNGWYAVGEQRNLLRWQEIANQAAAGTIASGDLAHRFETEIVPFWRDAEPRLRKQLPQTWGASRSFATALVDFASLRLSWARAIVVSTRSGNSQNAIAMMDKTDDAQARLDWFNLRTQFDHQAFSLAEGTPAAKLANIIGLNNHPCAKYPFLDFKPVASGDLAADGPARRIALECQAQHLFLTRDFGALEKMLGEARRHPGDLLDGDSSLSALEAGLDNLFEYGGLSVNAIMVRLADWRRAAPNSVESDLAEVEALIAWAYSARGLGTADTITDQNQMIFLHRIRIAKAALVAMESRGRNYAQWYSDTIDVSLLGNGKQEERSAIFSKAHAMFPNDLGIDDTMMHALMPRWGGSFEQVARFIYDQVQQKPSAPTDVEKYAKLYWDYAGLEGEGADIIKNVYAKPEFISLGLAMMMKRYPKSDYVINMAGRLACQSNQKLEYLVFHVSMPGRYSASAWSPNLSVEDCNKKFGIKS